MKNNLNITKSVYLAKLEGKDQENFTIVKLIKIMVLNSSDSLYKLMFIKFLNYVYLFPFS